MITLTRSRALLSWAGSCGIRTAAVRMAHNCTINIHPERTEPRPAATVAKIDYDKLLKEMTSLLSGERSHIANMANTASLIFHEWLATRGPDACNWVGFYLTHPQKNEELLLGPFMGKPATVRIPFSRGVCGAAARSRQVQLVQDVHTFPGHIACDSASNSEIVVPMIRSDGVLLGVLDMDSTLVGGYTRDDQAGLEKLVQQLIEACDWPERTGL